MAGVVNGEQSTREAAVAVVRAKMIAAREVRGGAESPWGNPENRCGPIQMWPGSFSYADI